jgi:hypothetical protein
MTIFFIREFYHSAMAKIVPMLVPIFVPMRPADAVQTPRAPVDQRQRL